MKMRGSIAHFLTHSVLVPGCDACTDGAPADRKQEAGEIFARVAELRDDYATEAMGSIIAASGNFPDPTMVGKLAYKYADAMLEARGPQPGKTPEPEISQ